MYKASFYDGTLKESEAIEFINSTNKPLKYTRGLKFRNPTTLRVPISKERALEIIATEWTDITEYDDYVDINTFSANDMW